MFNRSGAWTVRQKDLLAYALQMAQHDVDWLKGELQRLEQKIEAIEKEIREAMIAEKSSSLIWDRDSRAWLVNKEKDLREMLRAALQARLASPIGEGPSVSPAEVITADELDLVAFSRCPKVPHGYL